MLATENLPLIMSRIADDAVVLDIGGAAAPFNRADYVIDILPYERRNRDKSNDGGPERLSAETWIVHDICAREPLPLEDDSIDFAFCSHTLEDIRDPIWICSELSRVAKAGYIETPSRLAESTSGIQRDGWPGWHHHRWLVELVDQELVFLHKSPAMTKNRGLFVKSSHKRKVIRPELFALSVLWTGTLPARERVMDKAEYFDDLRAFARKHAADNIFLPRRNLIHKPRKRITYPRPSTPTAHVIGED